MALPFVLSVLTWHATSASQCAFGHLSPFGHCDRLHPSDLLMWLTYSPDYFGLRVSILVHCGDGCRDAPLVLLFLLSVGASQCRPFYSALSFA